MRPYERFRTDERGIEGLPIRLVIALVVGVASLSIMMGMINAIGPFGESELDVKPDPDVIAPGPHDVAVWVVGPEGKQVSNATVVVKGGTARLKHTVTERTNEYGVARVDIEPELGPNQVEGTVEFSVKPPAGSEYIDRRKNTYLLVIDG